MPTQKEIDELLAYLRGRHEAVNNAIQALERLDPVEPVRSKRGRKSVSPEEREVLRNRMLKYWSDRRLTLAKGLR